MKKEETTIKIKGDINGGIVEKCKCGENILLHYGFLIAYQKGKAVQCPKCKRFILLKYQNEEV